MRIWHRNAVGSLGRLGIGLGCSKLVGRERGLEMVLRDLAGVDTKIGVLRMFLTFKLGLGPGHHRSGGVEQMRATLNAYCVGVNEDKGDVRRGDDDAVDGVERCARSQ